MQKRIRVYPSLSLKSYFDCIVTPGSFRESVKIVWQGASIPHCVTWLKFVGMLL